MAANGGDGLGQFVVGKGNGNEGSKGLKEEERRKKMENDFQKRKSFFKKMSRFFINQDVIFLSLHFSSASKHLEI